MSEREKEGDGEEGGRDNADDNAVDDLPRGGINSESIPTGLSASESTPLCSFSTSISLINPLIKACHRYIHSGLFAQEEHARLTELLEITRDLHPP